jgi:hypothetical protein
MKVSGVEQIQLDPSPCYRGDPNQITQRLYVPWSLQLLGSYVADQALKARTINVAGLDPLKDQIELFNMIKLFKLFKLFKFFG